LAYLPPSPVQQNFLAALVVGAPGRGRVWRFDLATLIAKPAQPTVLLIDNMPIEGSRFGSAVTAAGSNVLAGDPFLDVAYLLDGADLTGVRGFCSPNTLCAASGDGEAFGSAVAAVGPDVAVGAP